MRSRTGPVEALRLMELAYAAAETLGEWEPFLLSLSESIDARGAALIQQDGASRITAGAVPADEVDLWVGQGRRGGAAASTGRPIASAVEANSRVLIAAARQPGTPALAVFRHPCDPPFERSHCRLVTAVWPHVRRALRIQEGIGNAQAMHALAVDALEAVPCAVLLVGRGARVVRMNRRARAILEADDGLSTAGVRLCAADERDTRTLRELCATAANVDQAGDWSGVMSLRRPRSNLTPLQVVVLPAAGVAEPLADSGAAVSSVIFVSDPAEERSPSEALITSAFGMTPAESHVAVRLAAGRGLAEIAAARGTALETVRRQARHVYAKAGARSRAELVFRISLMLVGPAHGGGARQAR